MTMFTQRETRILDQARDIIEAGTTSVAFSSVPLMMFGGA